MIIKPKVRGFICTTAHPVGCAALVQEQINFVKKNPPISGPKKVLVIGASTGFGLASRIALAFGSGADTIGLFFERPAAEGRTGSAGWYNTVAFTQAAQEAGRYAANINGDAFSNEVKEQTIALIKEKFGQVDAVVYSLASPRRVHPVTGEIFNSVLKPVGSSYTNKTVNFHSGEVNDITIEPATEEEIKHTVAVMGGEDWEMWIHALREAGVLADQATTVAYSYIGPEVTHAIYREGTIGKAKEDLEDTARRLNQQLNSTGGRALISVNKALVTQASSAIPIVPLYISLLYKKMKEENIHEGCIEQMYRLFAENLYGETPGNIDALGRIRMDNLEMREDIQSSVDALWHEISTDNLATISDIEGYRQDFYRLFGFEMDGVDYEEDVNENISF